jgi:hypothetical protein
MGSATEYRMALGATVLRAVGPARVDARAGSSVKVSFARVRLYPPTLGPGS